MRSYQNRAIEAAQVIEELIALAREMREANARGEQLGLSEDELAFYDALETNDSAVQILGDETLRDIARDLVETVRNNVTIDWTLRENVRANLRRLVRRILRQHGYPPDKQEQATQDSPRTSRSPLPRLGHRLTAASPPSLPALPALPAPHPLIAFPAVTPSPTLPSPAPIRPPPLFPFQAQRSGAEESRLPSAPHPQPGRPAENWTHRPPKWTHPPRN